jgi:predicted nucleotidyltransferase
MGNRLDQLRSQREMIIEIVERNKACNVSVFGSVARGEETAESDIDLLVDFLPGASLTDQFRLQEELTELLKTSVDVVSRRALKPRDTDIREEALSL